MFSFLFFLSCTLNIVSTLLRLILLEQSHLRQNYSIINYLKSRNAWFIWFCKEDAGSVTWKDGSLVDLKEWWVTWVHCYLLHFFTSFPICMHTNFFQQERMVWLKNQNIVWLSYCLMARLDMKPSWYLFSYLYIEKLKLDPMHKNFPKIYCDN